MSFTEQELRESLRRTTAAPPQAPDRMSLVEGAVRRRHRRLVAATVAAVVLALVAVPVVRLLPDRLRHNAIPAGTSPAQVDAMMKYATFVAAWSGISYGLERPDPGVVGVTVTWNLPPYNCIRAAVDSGGPQGTQSGWILATPSAIRGNEATSAAADIVTPYVLWPTGVPSCEPASAGSMLASGPDGNVTNLLSWDLVFGQELADPSRPALDVEAVYRAIPDELVTDFGRQVFAGYERTAPASYGTETARLDRVLTALGSWVGIALSRRALVTRSPATGPTILTADTYVGTASLPAGFTARWDTATGTFCVQGSVGGSGMQHLTDDAFADLGSPPKAPVDGPCR